MPNPKTQVVAPSLDWTSSVRYLKGIGPEKEKLLARLELEILADLFYFFPRRYEKRFPIKHVSELLCVEKECVSGTVIKRRFARFRGGRGHFRAELSDGNQAFEVIYYNQSYLTDVFIPGARVLLYGKAEKDAKGVKMIHPEYEILKDSVLPVHGGRWTPVYPLTEDLSQKTMRHTAHRAVNEHLGSVRDFLPEPLRAKQGLTPLAEAFRGIHFPKDIEDLKKAYRRLVFDEFFTLRLAVEFKKAALRKENRFTAGAAAEEELKRWSASLDFQMTGAQTKVINEIIRDMKSQSAMHRLLQGDVGSGKTVVAAAATLFAAKSGVQTAVMAPTEVLAQQLFFQMQRFLEPSGIRCVYLAQAVSAEEKKEAIGLLESGEAQVAVGTHSLLGKGVHFKRLGLAVVDEQHKFGVFQRAMLTGKGEAPHLLLMTATPIPRTLSMTLYGDLDISSIDERPKGRGLIRTLWLEEGRRESVYRWLDSFLSEGAQAFVICPKVDGKGSEVKSATEEFERLSKLFPKKHLGLLHGRLKAPQKSEVMRRFKDKKIDLLVSTVVVEVGVDVPGARCMIIENAERFGLAQLHQLRGRIGRGEGESYCLLFSSHEDEQSADRLLAFEKMESGFDIAEKDLKQRGAGEMLGQRQHGFSRLRIGNLEKDMSLFFDCQREAALVIAADPGLENPENKPYWRLLRERYGAISKLKGALSA